MFGYLEEFTYLGSPSEDRIALANNVAEAPAADFATWTSVVMPAEGTSGLA